MIPLDLSQIITKTQDLPGWCTAEKAEYLCELILEHQPRIVVETGIFGGRSLIPMAAACKYLKHGVVWGIDPWTVEASLEGEHEEADRDWWGSLENEPIFRQFVQAVLDLDLGVNCRFLRMRSDQAVAMFADCSVGLFHCDGNHSELVSCKDVGLWLPKMKMGGIWVHDDLDWPTNKKAFAMISKGRTVLKNTGQWAVIQI